MTRDERKLAQTERAFKVFCAKLNSAGSLVDAKRLVNNSYRGNWPGKEYYSRLGFFLNGLVPPSTTSRGELSCYLDLIDRIDDAGELREGSAERIREGLRNAISSAD
jgi:hypothetical protein